MVKKENGIIYHLKLEIKEGKCTFYIRKALYRNITAKNVVLSNGSLHNIKLLDKLCMNSLSFNNSTNFKSLLEGGYYITTLDKSKIEEYKILMADMLEEVLLSIYESIGLDYIPLIDYEKIECCDIAMDGFFPNRRDEVEVLDIEFNNCVKYK